MFAININTLIPHGPLSAVNIIIEPYPCPSNIDVISVLYHCHKQLVDVTVEDGDHVSKIFSAATLSFSPAHSLVQSDILWSREKKYKVLLRNRKRLYFKTDIMKTV